MKKLARKLRCNQTDVEQKLWSLLRDRQLVNCKFRRQHPIGPYIVDFCCIQRRLIVELDGSQHLAQKKEDELRTQYLNKNGYRVVRFWDNQVLKETDAVLEVIRISLNDPHPSPLPVRHKDGGSVLWRKREREGSLS